MNSIESLKNDKGEIEKENIKKIIPYKDSFLYIDKVLSVDKKKIIAIKEVKEDEYWVSGHFADFPVMPGALIVEGFGQASTLLIRNNLENHENYDVLAYKITSAKFYRPTFPGQTIRFEIKLRFKFKLAWFVKGKVFREGKIISKAKMVLAVVDRKKFRGRYSKK